MGLLLLLGVVTVLLGVRVLEIHEVCFVFRGGRCLSLLTGLGELGWRRGSWCVGWSRSCLFWWLSCGFFSVSCSLGLFWFAYLYWLGGDRSGFGLWLNGFGRDSWFRRGYWSFALGDPGGCDWRLLLFDLNSLLRWGLGRWFLNYCILWSWLGGGLSLRFHSCNWLWCDRFRWHWLNDWLGNWHDLLFRDRSRCRLGGSQSGLRHHLSCWGRRLRRLLRNLILQLLELFRGQAGSKGLRLLGSCTIGLASFHQAQSLLDCILGTLWGGACRSSLTLVAGHRCYQLLSLGSWYLWLLLELLLLLLY